MNHFFYETGAGFGGKHLDRGAALETALQSFPVAAFIVEPIPANMGVVLPQPGYLEGARALYRAALARDAGPERQARLALGLGMLALAAGDWAEADPWLARAEGLALGMEYVSTAEVLAALR